MNKKIAVTGRQKNITREEYSLLLEMAKKENYRNYFLLLLLGNLGLRVGEGVRLRKEDIDFKNGIIKIPTLKRVTKEKRGTIKKNVLPADYEILPFAEELIKECKHYLKKYKIICWLFKGRKKGDHLDESTAKTIFLKYVTALKIKASIHSLRHFKGYTLYEDTGDIKKVQIWLRHRSVMSTMIYTQPTLELKRKIAEQTKVII